eukprot:2320423-Rhodomonas_salina.1
MSSAACIVTVPATSLNLRMRQFTTVRCGCTWLSSAPCASPTGVDSGDRTIGGVRANYSVGVTAASVDAV